MDWWTGNASWTVWNWWWVLPIICITICFIMHRYFRPRMSGRRFCCWSRIPPDDYEDMKREIKKLKEDFEKHKEK